MKSLFYTCFFWLLLFVACDQVPSNRVVKLTGPTMGTAYNVTYIDTSDINLQPSIDSLLIEINNSMSTYLDSSTISRFNSSSDTTQFEIDYHFIAVMTVAADVWTSTEGAFDPTVMPLVSFWGFGKQKNVQPDTTKIDSLKSIVGFEMVAFNSSEGIKKRNAAVQLDFSAIAKGYAVDEVSYLLEQHNVRNYLVEIGGEVKASGKNAKGQYWRIGIDKPNESLKHQVFSILELKNEAMATSGNYRNFYEKGGKKYVHTINPNTGYPEISNTLSVTVLSADCTVADAYATAFMVMGVDRGLKLANHVADIEAYFIYADTEGNLKTKSTSGLKGRVIEKN